MSTEQSFSSQVEAVMQRGRVGEQDPADQRLIREVEQVVSQGLGVGEGAVAQALASSAAWQDAVDQVRGRHSGDDSIQSTLDRLVRAIPVAARETLLTERGIPLDVRRDTRTPDYDNRLDELRVELRQLARGRLFAELIEPAQTVHTTDRSDNGMRRHITRHRNAIMQTIGMSGSIETSDFVSKNMQREPESENFAELRAYNRVLTEAMIVRFLERSPLSFQRASGRHGGNNIDYDAPTHEPMQNERVKRTYQNALTSLLNGLEADTDWTEVERNAMRDTKRMSEFPTSRLTRAHEIFVSHLFDGITFEGTLAPGQDLRALVEHTEHSDPKSERTASFARGVALHILIEGGDMISYAQAMRALPMPERTRMGEVAQQIYSQCTNQVDRERISQILQNVHGLAPAEAPASQRQEQTDAERARRQAEAEEMLQATNQQIEERILRVNLESAQMQGESRAISRVASELQSSQGNLRHEMPALGKQLVWAKVTQDILMAELSQEAQKYVDGKATSVDYSDRVQKVFALLERIDDAQCVNPDTLQYVRDAYKPALSQDEQKTLVLARFSGLLLSQNYFKNEANMAHLVARLMYNAKNHPDILGGATQEDILEVYNRTMVAVAEYDIAVAATNSDFQFSMANGLQAAVNSPGEWRTAGPEPMTIKLPGLVFGDLVPLPDLAGGFKPMYLDDTTRAQSEESLRLNARRWAQEHIAPVAQVVEQLRVAKQYAVTVHKLAGTLTTLESQSYVPPTERLNPPEDIKPILDKLTPYIQHISNLAEVDEREKSTEFTARRNKVQANRESHGQAAIEATQAIETFLGTHGDELRNPQKKFGLVRYSQQLKQAMDQLDQTLNNLYAGLGLNTKQLSLKTVGDYNLAKTTIARETTDPQNGDLVSLRGDIQELDRGVPTLVARARAYLAARTRPPYDADSPNQIIESIRMPTNGRGTSSPRPEREHSMNVLLADHPSTSSVVQELMRDFLVQDHAWCEPIYRDVHIKREAIKHNANGTPLEQEVTASLLAIEQRLTAYPDSKDRIFPTDKRAVAAEILGLFKRAITPLVSADRLATLDTLPVASIGAGSLKAKLDRDVIKNLATDYSPVSIRLALARW